MTDYNVNLKVAQPVELAQSNAPPPAVSGLVRAGYWIWGTVLTIGLAAVGYVLLRAALCVDPSKSTKDVTNLAGCAHWVQSWYLIRSRQGT